MQYFTAIRLDSAAAIRAWAINDIHAQIGSELTQDQHRVRHTLPEDLLNMLTLNWQVLDVLPYCICKAIVDSPDIVKVYT
jgi:hypothetical protein